MIFSALMAAQTAMSFALVKEPTWPRDYQCLVVTDTIETITFNVSIENGKLKSDRTVLILDASTAVDLERAGLSLRSDGNNYSRFLVSSNIPTGKVWITQTGNVNAPSTQVFIDARTKETRPAERTRQANGYCVAVMPAQ